MIRRLLLALLLVLGAAGPARAVCTLPYTLVNNTLADANQVMADLNALLACVNANAMSLTATAPITIAPTPFTGGSGVIGSTGLGTVTSVTLSSPGGIFAVTGTNPITTSGTHGYSTTGTSGGIPYFSSGTQLSSSAALTANLPVFGGGAGVAPFSGTRTGNTTLVATSTGAQTSAAVVVIDADGNHVAGSSAVGVMPLAIGWIATNDPAGAPVANINANGTITAIVGSVETAVGAAATVSVYKAPSATACSAGTVLHSGSFNANGTAATNQTLTVTTSSVSAGDRICLQSTGGANWTSGTGIGGITVFYKPS